MVRLLPSAQNCELEKNPRRCSQVRNGRFKRHGGETQGVPEGSRDTGQNEREGHPGCERREDQRGEEGREGRSRYKVDPAGCGGGEKRGRAHGGKRLGGFFDTVVGRNKRLFTKKGERSGKGERGETEGQDVTRRNATGRRLNPVGKLGGGKVGRNNRLRFSETHPRRSSKGFKRRPVVFRQLRRRLAFSPPFMFPAPSAF